VNVTVQLPDLHIDQVRAYLARIDERGGDWDRNKGGRFKSIRCGRRWGKTVLGETWLGDGAAKGEPCGWFAPSYKYIPEVYNDLYDILEPIKKASSKTEGVIRTVTGGRIDFWTLEDDRAGRSRHYKRVFLDEIAFTKNNMMNIWKQAIKPTLLDYNGRCIAASNTNGVDPENFLYQIAHEAEHGFIDFHAPSINNPLIPIRQKGETEAAHLARRLAVFEDLKAREHPLVFRQEYEAEFVDWSGVAFFALDKLLVDGKPVPTPVRCDYVYGVIDSATKTGTANDGTAITFFARTKTSKIPLAVLDWDIVQIEGAMLEDWIPKQLKRGEELARECGARGGFIGIFVEDKASGEILIQQGRKNKWPLHAIESRLTALGKDERAISVSGYHFRGEVKLTEHAEAKVVVFKGTSRNHLVSQITGFRVGDKEAIKAKRADDLLDTYTYGVALGLGNRGGF
jgi:hypothetical protein